MLKILNSISYKKRPTDIDQRAKLIVDVAIGETEEEKDTCNPNAVALGKLGGVARAQKLTAERRSEIAKKAAKKRWEKD